MTDASNIVPMRSEPSTPDDQDQKRIALVHKRWHAQDAACSERDRQVELAVRMLAGRQWDVWSEKRGRFIDPLQFLDERERLWRARPVYDYIEHGVMINVAKLTGSPPVIAAEPATSDQSDAQLAEVWDTIYKTLSYDAHMDEMREGAASWAYVTGQAFYKSRLALDEGETQELAGPAVLSMQSESGEPVERVTGRVPYDAEGNPQAELTDDGEGYTVPEGAEPHQQPEGKIVVDVLCPLELRSEWVNKPLEQKRWAIHRTYLTVDDVQERYGVTVKPDTNHDNSNGGYLERLKRGPGYFGSIFSRSVMGSGDQDGIASGDGYVCVDEMWEKPCPAYPQGRLLAVTKNTVLLDAPRPFPTLEGAGPFREVPCLREPGRMFPSTPVEKAIPLQKGLNRLWANIHEHNSKMANPIRLIDDRSGIEPDDITNQPGLNLSHHSPPGVAPLAYASPPALSGDVWRSVNETRDQLLMILGVPGSEGTTPTADASGELVEQLRYNADRAVSGIAHALVRAEAGVARDWLAMIKETWTQEKVLTYAGEDSVARMVTVLPEMFDGAVNVRPVMDSALPETRAEKRQRITTDYQLGIFGMPGTPEAVQWYQQNIGYPNLNRAWRPGGVDRMTAERNLNMLVRGAQAAELVLYEQYNFPVHMQVTRDFIAAPEFLKLDDPIKAQILDHFYTLQGASVSAALNQQKIQGATMMATTALAAQQQTQMQRLLPQPPAPDGQSGNAPGPSGPPNQAAPPGDQAA
jgi:hypothetical protein